MALYSATPPIDLIGVRSQADLPEAAMISLLDWCSAHARPAWATGESIYDCAWLMVERAVENGNLDEF
jgi:hypothetical protein